MNNTQANTIEKCRASLAKESILKAFLCGMAIGLATSFLVAFATWFSSFKGLWLTIVLGAVAWAASSLLFYFFKFKPTTADVMKRLDRAGLDERMITMYELRNDDSYMASVQRANATATFTRATAKAGGNLLKVKIPSLIIALACVAGGVGLAATVVTGLSDFGVIPTGIQLINGDWAGGPNDPSMRDYVFTPSVYILEGNERKLIDVDWDGFVPQTIRAGGSTAPIRAPKDFVDEETEIRYGFYCWVDSNGNEINPGDAEFSLKKTYSGVTSNIELGAVYWEIPEDADLNFSYYYDPDGKSEQGDGDGDGEPGDPNGEDGPPGNMPANHGPGGGSPADTSDNIVDGNTPYQAGFDGYYDSAMDALSDGGDGYPSEMGELTEGYFGIL